MFQKHKYAADTCQNILLSSSHYLFQAIYRKKIIIYYNYNNFSFCDEYFSQIRFEDNKREQRDDLVD